MGPKSGGPKKLVVKLREAPSITHPENDKQRDHLRAAVRAIQARSNNTQRTLEVFSLEELFSSVQTQVEAQQGPALHALLGDEFGSCAAAEVAALASHLALDTTTFLQRLVALWEHYSHHLDLIRPVALPTAATPVHWWHSARSPFNHPLCIALLLPCRQVFLYLDRAYVVSNPGTLNVFQLGLHQLRCQLQALPHVREGGGISVARHALHFLDFVLRFALECCIFSRLMVQCHACLPLLQPFTQLPAMPCTGAPANSG